MGIFETFSSRKDYKREGEIERSRSGIIQEVERGNLSMKDLDRRQKLCNKIIPVEKTGKIGQCHIVAVAISMIDGDDYIVEDCTGKRFIVDKASTFELAKNKKIENIKFVKDHIQGYNGFRLGSLPHVYYKEALEMLKQHKK